MMDLESKYRNSIENAQKRRKKKRAFEREEARKTRAATLERQKSADKATMNRQKKKQEAERKKRLNERGDKLLQRQTDKHYAREIGEGRLSPQYASKMSEQGQERLMMQRPDLFSGASVSGSGTSGGSGSSGGLSATKAQNIWTDSLEKADETFNTLGAQGGGGLSRHGLTQEKNDKGQTVYKDMAGNEIPYQQARTMIAKREYMNRMSVPGMAFGQNQQQPQQTGAQNWQEIENNIENREVADRQNLQENLITSYVDEQGNPVDASQVQQAGGEGQNYGTLPDGTKVYQKFSLAGRDSQIPDTQGMGAPPAESVASVGFGGGRQEATGQNDPIRQAIDRVFAGDEARAKRREKLEGAQGGGKAGQTEGASQYEEAQGEAGKNQKASAQAKRQAAGEKAKAGQGERKAPTFRAPKTQLKIEENDNQAVREMKQRLNVLLDPEKLGGKLSDAAKWWEKKSGRNMPTGKEKAQRQGIVNKAAEWWDKTSGRNMPESPSKANLNRIALALRDTGLKENDKQLRAVAKKFIENHPDASVNEIIKRIKASAK